MKAIKAIGVAALAVAVCTVAFFKFTSVPEPVVISGKAPVPAAPAPIATASSESSVLPRAQAIPTLSTTFGRPVDTDGLLAAAFIQKMSPQARRGDAAAAYRVYQVEAMCAQYDRQSKVLAAMTGLTDEDRVREQLIN
jgi:hypothetical protein